MKGRSLRSLVLAVALAAAIPVLADPMAEIVGRWRDSDGESEIAISRCGAALCGKIVWLKQERFDIHNPDAKLRTRSLLGLQVLIGFGLSGCSARTFLTNCCSARQTSSRSWPGSGSRKKTTK